ncbi:hypothetical protein [Streptomyces sp. CAU 1734]|uniref:hypothetical protein n=1 Tax=Streptomyces sp. CAU 1734 TaxID=3140360 RepID=UPI003261BE73
MPSSWRSWHRPLLFVSALMALSAAVSAVGLVVDDRILVGSPIWAKPFKFSVSFLVYGISLAWMLSLSTRARRVGHWAGTLVAVATVVEMAIVIAQVVRGRRSHFNNETDLDTTLFGIMGNTIVVLWLATLVIAILLFRTPLRDRASAWALRLGSPIALIGAALGFLMTFPTRAQQAAADRGERPDTTGAHSVGVTDGGPSMPVTGWSTTGGDMRIPHFIGMHALQLLPLLVLALVFLARRHPRLRDERVRVRLVVTAAGVLSGLVALTTWQAQRGQALIHPDGATITALAALLALGAAAALLSLRTPGAPAAGLVPDTRTRESTAPGTDPAGRTGTDTPEPAGPAGTAGRRSGSGKLSA